ncbi:MAG: hypothetical protein CMP22_01965 [Rickettsiales bacterium]|nr:hypothetical protein [Rickettsiales bacterium]
MITTLSDKYPKVLCIGAFDPSNSTGLGMDLKTTHSLGAQAVSLATSVYLRKDGKVIDRMVFDADFVKKQIDSIGSFSQFDAIKVGDLVNSEIIDVVGDAIDEAEGQTKVVLDTVLFSSCKTHVMDATSRSTLKRRILLRADVVTPTVEEAKILSGIDIDDLDELKHLAETLMTLGPSSVVIRGTIVDESKIVDVVHIDGSDITFETETNVNKFRAKGLSAALTAAIATEIAKGQNVVNSIHNARQFVSIAVEDLDNSAKVKEPQGVDPLYAMQRLYESGL